MQLLTVLGVNLMAKARKRRDGACLLSRSGGRRRWSGQPRRLSTALDECWRVNNVFYAGSCMSLRGRGRFGACLGRLLAMLSEASRRVSTAFGQPCHAQEENRACMQTPCLLARSPSAGTGVLSSIRPHHCMRRNARCVHSSVAHARAPRTSAAQPQHVS